MITLPWQVIAGFIALFGLSMIINYLKKTDCDERVEAARREERRDTMAAYRQVYNTAREQGKNDA